MNSEVIAARCASKVAPSETRRGEPAGFVAASSGRNDRSAFVSDLIDAAGQAVDPTRASVPTISGKRVRGDEAQRLKWPGMARFHGSSRAHKDARRRTASGSRFGEENCARGYRPAISCSPTSSHRGRTSDFCHANDPYEEQDFGSDGFSLN